MSTTFGDMPFHRVVPHDQVVGTVGTFECVTGVDARGEYVLFHGPSAASAATYLNRLREMSHDGAGVLAYVSTGTRAREYALRLPAGEYEHRTFVARVERAPLVRLEYGPYQLWIDRRVTNPQVSLRCQMPSLSADALSLLLGIDITEADQALINNLLQAAETDRGR